MNTLILEDLPEHLHARLKEQATRNRRSVSREAFAILSANLVGVDIDNLPPYKAKALLTDELLEQAKREGARVTVDEAVAPRRSSAPLTDEQIERLRAAERAHRPFKGKFPLTDEFLDRAQARGREAEDCDLPEPIKGNALLTDEMVDRAKREGRE